MYGRPWVRLPSGTLYVSLSHASDIQNIVSFLYRRNVVTFRVKLFSLSCVKNCEWQTSQEYWPTRKCIFAFK